MSKNIPNRPPIALAAVILAILFLVTGCDENRRVAEVAREAADRQAEQNRQIAHQNHEIAEATKTLVEADAGSRKELVGLQRDLQGDQAEAAKQRDLLESERRQIAATRLRESLLAPIIEQVVAALVCATAIALCCFLLYGLRHDRNSDPELTELLVEDLFSQQRLLLPSPAVVTDYPRALPGIPEGQKTLTRTDTKKTFAKESPVSHIVAIKTEVR